MLVMFKGDEGKDIAIDDEDVSAVEQAGEYAKAIFTEAHQSTGTGPHKGAPQEQGGVPVRHYGRRGRGKAERGGA